MEKRGYSKNIANAISSFLTEDGWHYRFNEEDGIYRMGLGLEGSLGHVDLYIHVYDDFFTVSAVSPIKVRKDPDKRREMAEFICQANYGLKCGGFQYDIQNGEVLYRIHVSCHDIVPSRKMVKHSLYIPAVMFDKYSEGMFAVLFGGSNARDAVDTCERPSSESAEILETLETAAKSEDDDPEDMFSRLIELLGITGDDAEDDVAEFSVPAEGQRAVRVNLFS